MSRGSGHLDEDIVTWSHWCMWSVVIPASPGASPRHACLQSTQTTIHLLSCLPPPHPHSALHCYLVHSSGIVPPVQLNWSPPDGTEEQQSGSMPARSETRPLRELGRRGGRVCGPVTHPTLPVDSVGCGCR